MMGVPTFYTRLLDEPAFTAIWSAHMRLFVSGSAPASGRNPREFEQRTGHRILERYGMTETNMNTSNPYDGERRAGTVGFPLPGVELAITDPDSGKVLPHGEIGRSRSRAPTFSRATGRCRRRRRRSFRDDGFFITGDLGGSMPTAMSTSSAATRT
jgi:malonyl-CoA/methylmalonyl-CoA synthetase